MLRIFTVSVISFLSFFPIYMFVTEVCGLNDDFGAVVAIALAIIAVPAVLLKLWKEKPSPEVIPVNVNDPVMKEFVEKSRKQIDRLIEGLEEEKKEAYVKFPYRFGGEIEHVWGTAHYIKDGYVIVSLDSSPVGDLPEEVYGRLKIKLEEIEDWMLVDTDGTTFGGYSILAHAKIYTREYGSLPRDYERYLKRFVDFDWPEIT
ncbi:Uncharacterized conserved protein YegJ, DUF2314 family [Microbulbifer thermotolerans]|uniref:DUF2314 domain-containing protein n=1 Tax=Microbulbifer thermotolerans TaxID=252514 RepID=UPI0008DF8112|nr:DUF2314 domain-containing protein [Microbulbifer thermotolerans]SFC74694.1 Uncharacterized conserved protein YegJ, DUF2314 family [Microbulbifer thermotolerans]